ncbi:MAG: flagellar basal body P-ring formation protein FlgA [Pseudomonadota bacterium]|jgi:flagella basal body P-ring formation protein FlgA
MQNSGLQISPPPIRNNTVNNRQVVSIVFSMLLFLFTSTFAIADELTETIGQFIRQQTSSIAGEVTYSIGQIEGQKKLPPCTAYQPFFPNGGQQIGNITIGVRCLTPSNWTIYIPVKVRVVANYILSAHPLAAGQVISSSDLQENKGDVSTMPPGILFKREQAIGKTARFSIAAGQILRAEQLTAPLLIRQNQSVRLITGGPGFTASTEGKALNNAAEGQVVQVRTSSGTTVSGIAQHDGSVAISLGK